MDRCTVTPDTTSRRGAAAGEVRTVTSCPNPARLREKRAKKSAPPFRSGGNVPKQRHTRRPLAIPSSPFVRSLRKRLAQLLRRERRLHVPEIRGDEFAARIAEIARNPRVRTILEVGSAAGEGSTEAFVAGIERNPSRPTLFCLEARRDRFEALAARYADRPFVRPYHASSVGRSGFASAEHVRSFYEITPTALNRYPLERVLGWLQEDLRTLAELDVEEDGIELIRREHGIDRFDVVLLDGSEFTAAAELDLVHGARYVLLDDINSFKNHLNCQRLLADPAYSLLAGNAKLRNGYAIFERAR